MGDPHGTASLPPDVIGDEPRRRPRRWPIVVVIAAIAVLLLLRWADDVERVHEFGTLLQRAEVAQQDVTQAAALVDSTRQYTMPLLVSSSSATVRAGLAALIDQSAARGEVDVRADRAALDRLTVLPWHSRLRQAKAAYLGYLDRRIADLEAAAHGGDIAAIRTPSVETDFAISVDAVRNAAPRPSDAARTDRLLRPVK